MLPQQQINIKKKLKIIKKLKKFCPECGESELVLIPKVVQLDGVSYTDKYEFCVICEYERKSEKVKNKNNSKNGKLYLLPEE